MPWRRAFEVEVGESVTLGRAVVGRRSSGELVVCQDGHEVRDVDPEVQDSDGVFVVTLDVQAVTTHAVVLTSGADTSTLDLDSGRFVDGYPIGWASGRTSSPSSSSARPRTLTCGVSGAGPRTR